MRPGDTYAQISDKTGLTIDQLEAFNPNTDQFSLAPGQRLNLWQHPPAPRPKPLGPRFWTVRPGDSFGSIAATTGINLAQLEQLNPRLNPSCSPEIGSGCAPELSLPPCGLGAPTDPCATSTGHSRSLTIR